MSRGRRNNVSCRNIKTIVKYVEKVAGDIPGLLQDLPYSESYLLNPEEWVPLKVYSEIMKRTKVKLQDPDAPYKIGLSSLDTDAWGAFKYIERVMARTFFSPCEGYKRVPKYNRNFNDTKTIDILEMSKTLCIFKIQLYPGIDPVEDFDSDPYIQGILACVPRIWELPEAEVENILLPYNILHLLEKVYGDLNFKAKFEGSNLYINGELYGRGVILLPEKLGGGKDMFFLGKYQEVTGDSLSKRDTGVLITRDLIVGTRTILKRGQIYEAPYFIVKVRWKEKNLLGKLVQLFKRLKLLGEARSKLDYLEERLLVEQRYARSMDMLERYVPAVVARKLAQSGAGLDLGGSRAHVTILFCDINDFTPLAESLPPEEVMEILNDFFSSMSKIIFHHLGTIVNFNGDEVMVVFGVPLPCADHAQRAIQCALDMQKGFEQLQQKWKSESKLSLEGIKIGINSGSAIIGNVGSSRRMQYTAIGDSVNLASRIMNLNKRLSSVVLISHSTYELAKGLFKLEPMGNVSVKGKEEKNPVYKVALE